MKSLRILAVIILLLERIFYKFSSYLNNIAKRFNKLYTKNSKFAEYRTRKPTLIDPSLSTIFNNVHDEFYINTKRYYDDGIVVLQNQPFKKDIPKLLIDIKKIFQPMTEYFDQAPNIYKYNTIWDSSGRRWYFNKFMGTLQLHVPNMNNYSTQQNPNFSGDIGGHINLYNTNSLKKDFPLLKKILEDKLLKKFVSYSNNTNELINSIVIERRTHAPVADRDDFLPHVDKGHGVFKSFIYLNNVNQSNGPLYISKGSHHWGLYPKFLKDIYLRKMGDTSIEKALKTDIKKKWGINPLEPGVGSAGDQILFCPNALHHASSPIKNLERWTVQIYYNSELLWASDK